MNGNSALESTLKDILDAIVPSREDWFARVNFIQELQDVVKSVESLRGATVEPYGSFVSKLFTRWGDLDISIMLCDGSYFSSAGKNYKQSLLEVLQIAMRQKGVCRRLQFIPNARVPILKVESSRQNISCDISINNFPGQVKSKILCWISEIDGRFCDMVLLVKEWAKSHNIGNPNTGTLNSYSLCLLVIFHFQTCVPPILPPLKDIYPRNVVDDLKGLRREAEKRIEEICLDNINRYRSDKCRAINQSSLSELFLSFLEKFSDISLKAAELGICTFTGRWEAKRSNPRWLVRPNAIYIEDPFEQPENAARAVEAGNLRQISEAFQTTYHKLVSADQSRMSILSELVRPQVSNVIAGTPVRNSSRAKSSLTQVQNQIQNMNIAGSTNQRRESYPNSLNRQSTRLQYGNQSLQRKPNSLT